MYHFLNVQTNQNRQQFGQYYRINGAIYLMRISEYSSHMALYGEKSYAYRMPKERSIDIDDEMDLEIAKVFMKFKNR